MKRPILRRWPGATLLLLCFLIAGSTADSLSAETLRFYVTEQESPDAVTFTTAARFEYVHGSTDDINGWFDFDTDNATELSGELQVDLNTLQTGIGLLDQQMRERHLETEEFPYAVLELSGVSGLPEQMDVDASYDFTVLGRFTIHGITQEIEIAAGAVLQEPDSEGAANLQVLLVTAEFSIELDDYGIPRPTAPLLDLIQNIDVRVKFTATTVEPEPR